MSNEKEKNDLKENKIAEPENFSEQESKSEKIESSDFSDAFDEIKQEREMYFSNVMEKNDKGEKTSKKTNDRIINIKDDLEYNPDDDVNEILKAMNSMNIREDEVDALEDNKDDINVTKEFLTKEEDLKEILGSNKDKSLEKSVEDDKAQKSNKDLKELWIKIKKFFTINEEKIEPDDDPWFVGESKKDENLDKIKKEDKKLFSEKKKILHKKNEKLKITESKEKSNNKNEDYDKEEIIDYNKKEDASIIRREILKSMRKLFIRTMITGVLMISSILLTISARSSIKFLNFRDDFFDNNLWYLIISLVLLVLSAISCKVTILNGITPLFNFKGNSDSAIAFATLMCSVQGLVAVFSQERFDLNGFSIYSCIAIFGLFCNSIGKLIVVKRVCLNFNYITSDKKKFVGKIYSNGDNLDFISKETGIKTPVIAYQKKSENLTDFLRLSYKPDLSEEFAGKIAPFGVIISFFAFLLSLFITKDIFASMTTLAITSCLCVPFACIIAINEPILNLCKRANSKGAMLIGYPGVLQFADTNLVYINSNELYNKGATAIHGVKSFGSFSIDKTILYAAALLEKAEAPLSSTFDDIINHRKEILPVVEKWEYLDGLGIIGFIQGKRILLGNRKLLENNNISPPPRSSEEKFVEKGKKILYVSIEKELSAMFLVSYKPKDNLVYWMQKMEDNGINFLIKTSDPNITAKLISEQFRVSFKSVKILNNELSCDLNNKINEKDKKDRCYLCTDGRLSTFSRMVTSCVRLRANAIATMITQAVTVILGCCFILMLSFYAGINEIKVLNMLAYVVFWTVVIILVPRIRKM